MKYKNWLFLFTFILPITTFADITVTNNTDSYGTAYINRSPCSSMTGGKGIIQPYQSNFVIAQSVLDTFCFMSECVAHVFSTKDCEDSGKEIAGVEIDRKKGILHIINYNQKRFDIIGSGTRVTINPAKKGWRKWFDWF